MSKIIDYNLPDVTADEAADKAIEILTAVEQVGGQSLYYCLRGSNVLAFAGLRSMSPYTAFHSDFAGEKMDELNETLKRFGCVVLRQDEYGADNTDSEYVILNTKTLDEIAGAYPILADAVSPPKNEQLSWWMYRLWAMTMWNYIAGKLSDDEETEKWLKGNWWTPYELQFSMMLGYPGVALVNRCEWAIGELDREKDMDYVYIQVNGNDVYDDMDVSYVVSKKGINNPQIVTHSTLWTEALQKVYDAFPEAKLNKIIGFKEERARFSRKDE